MDHLMALLPDLHRSGINVSMADDQLVLDGPRGALTPDLRARLVALKPELLIYLRLEPALMTAEDWRDLEVILDDAQMAYEDGLLTADAVERLAALARQQALALPEDAAELRLAEWLQEKPLRRVYSRVLGEAVLFAADDADLPAGNALVVFRASELCHLAGRSPEHVQSIHATKKASRGELQPHRRRSGIRDNREEAALACN